MRISLIALAGTLLGASLVAAPQSPQVATSAATAAAPTFYKDVLPVLQKNCQACHRPGEVAPMSLLTYEQTRPWARAIKNAVTTRQMPPWFADPAYGHFSNERRLSERDIAAINAWVDAGAPAGVFRNLYLTTEQVAEVIAHRAVRGVTLTGSTRAGREVAAVAVRAARCRAAVGFGAAGFGGRFDCHTRSGAAATSSIVRPDSTLAGLSATMSSVSLAASSRLLNSSQLSPRPSPLVRTRCHLPVSFSPSSMKVSRPFASAARGSPSGCQVPRSHTTTVPPPYSPFGMTPSKEA